MHKNIKKNIKVINGEVKFVKLRRREGQPFVDDDSANDNGKPKKENFFSRRNEDKIKEEEQ